MTSLPLASAFTCFSMFVYFHAGFHFVLIGENLTTQSMGSYKGIVRGIQISKALLPFPTTLPDHLRELALWLRPALSNISYKHKVCIIYMFILCLLFSYKLTEEQLEDFYPEGKIMFSITAYM